MQSNHVFRICMCEFMYMCVHSKQLTLNFILNTCKRGTQLQPLGVATWRAGVAIMVPSAHAADMATHACSAHLHCKGASSATQTMSQHIPTKMSEGFESPKSTHLTRLNAILSCRPSAQLMRSTHMAGAPPLASTCTCCASHLQKYACTRDPTANL